MTDAGRPSERTTIGEAIADGRAVPIQIDPESRRIEARAGDEVAFMTYRERGAVLSLIHTEVPEPLRGQGMGEALAQAALEHARARGMTVKPYCPFVADYIRRHPELHPLVDPEFHLAPGDA